MRTVAEWLVLPVFLLPLLFGAGLVLQARRLHEAEMAPYREDAVRQVAAWLEGGPAAWMPRAFADDYAPGGAGLGDEAMEVPFTHPAGDGRVRLAPGALAPLPWTFVDGFPTGLSPSALADPALRLAVERGTPAATLDAVDEGTRILKTLLDTPDLDALRRAPLPPATKAFLLSRWQAAAPNDAALRAAALLVTAVRQRHGAGTPGHNASCDAFYPGTTASLVLLCPPGAPPLPARTYVEDGPADGAVRLTWLVAGAHDTLPGEVWRGRIEQPIAGTFAFSARHGTAWWKAPRVRRWAGPAGLVLLAFLLLPLGLLLALRRRRRLDEARVRFINEMAHDLRTPVASLRLHADMLSTGKGRAEARPQYIHALSQEAARLSSLLGNLLDLSRLERGRRSFSPQTLVLADEVAPVVGEILTMHPDRRGDLRVGGPGDASVQADREGLRRVLLNLLENATRFTDAGTPIRLTWTSEPSSTLLLVSDEGPGIPSAERGRIFERYVRGSVARRDGVPGTGLGLALVKELVEGMGGTVRLLVSDTGASFEVRLPGGRDAEGPQ